MSLNARTLAAQPSAPARTRPVDLDTAVFWTSVVAIAATALVLRLYHLVSYVAFYPDSYGQLRAAENLASLQFPISYYYPPGIALFLAPFFAVLPDSLLTMQIAILAAGLALVGVAYAWGVAATGDRRAALIYAFAVAIGATFVFHSRIALFEVINTLLIASSLWLAPAAVRRGPAAWVGYGVLAFAMVTARYTNVIVLPALVLAAMGGSAQRPSWRQAIAIARSPAALVAGLVVLALGAVYIGTAHENLTRFTSSENASIVGFDGYGARLLYYTQASLNGYSADLGFTESVAAGVLLALALVGAQRLWRSNPSLLVAIVYLAAVWGPVHALYEGAYLPWIPRYATAVYFILLLPASIGLSAALDGWQRLDRPWQRVPAAGFLALSVTLVASAQLSQDLTFFSQLYDSPAARTEASFAEIRRALRETDGENALLISSQILAVDRANPEMDGFDLARHSSSYGINDDSVRRFVAYVDEQLAKGRTVYYYYTPYEAAQSKLHRYELGFDAYFSGLQEHFSLVELARVDERPHRLYLVEPP
ncbi:MAG: hypothetical protein WEB04_07320 [Dehalococcoidia bacterium]